MRERFPETRISSLHPSHPRRRVRFRLVYPDLFYGFRASALLTVAIFLFRLPQWFIALAGGVLALWFISMALARMQRNLALLRGGPERAPVPLSGSKRSSDPLKPEPDE